MSEEATNPELDLEPAPEQEVVPLEEKEPHIGSEEDFEGDKGEEAPPEMVEVEIDGQTHSVPVALKDGFLRTADYTRKTQELAEQRRQAEETLQKEHQSFQQQVQTQRQNFKLYGQLANVESQLEQLAEANLAKIFQEDPDKAQELGFYRENLRDQRDRLEEEIETQEHDSRVRAEREVATRKDQLETALARDIPDYTPELRTEMTQTAVKHGFTKQEVDSLLDPRMFQMLHLAHLGAKVLERQTATKPAKPVKPVPKVTGGKTPSQGPTDKQSTANWMDSRNQQLKRRA